jgi:hypothetical protein
MHFARWFLGQGRQGVAFRSQFMAQIINSRQKGAASIMALSFNNKIILVSNVTV